MDQVGWRWRVGMLCLGGLDYQKGLGERDPGAE